MTQKKQKVNHEIYLGRDIWNRIFSFFVNVDKYEFYHVHYTTVKQFYILNCVRKEWNIKQYGSLLHIVFDFSKATLYKNAPANIREVSFEMEQWYRSGDDKMQHMHYNTMVLENCTHFQALHFQGAHYLNLSCFNNCNKLSLWRCKAIALPPFVKFLKITHSKTGILCSVLPQLKQLHLNGAEHYFHNGLRCLSIHKKLTKLALEGYTLEYDLSPLIHCAQLRHLDIAKLENWKGLKDLFSLCSLTIQYTQQGWVDVCSLKQLEILVILDFQEKLLHDIKTKFPNLKHCIVMFKGKQKDKKVRRCMIQPTHTLYINYVPSSFYRSYLNEFRYLDYKY